MDKVSSRYAEALLDIATQLDRLDEFKSQAVFIGSSFRDNPDFATLFNKTQISSEEKKTLLQEVFSTKVDPLMINLLCLLLDKKRIRMTELIMSDFVHLVNVSQSIEEGIVYSIRPLSKDDLDQLEKQLSLKHNVKVELVNKIDQSLISGLKIKFKESVIDASLSAQLEALRETLREGRS
jgi:F-type H+-transporting ATPase subunit delta